MSSGGSLLSVSTFHISLKAMETPININNVALLSVVPHLVKDIKLLFIGCPLNCNQHLENSPGDVMHTLPPISQQMMWKISKQWKVCGKSSYSGKSS